jgi:two-component system response regulator (stage 0 sporulation protein A)
MEKRIRNLLKKCGVPCHILGYEYLVEAVRLCVDDMEYVHMITKKLYPTIAKKFDTKWTRVERAIRHAITIMFDNLDPDTMFELFGNTIPYNTGKPTNAHFIATITELIKEGN